MPDSKARMESMLFDYATTYKTDYQKNPIREPVLTTYKKKERCMMIRPPPLRDIHTLSDWKAAAIPFDLLLKRKDITGTNPKSVQKRYEKPVDAGREEAQKARPRLVMTPAVSMDDVTDTRARTILCEDMYTSDMTRGLREAVSPYFSVEAPLPGLPASSNPVVIPKLQLPVVPLEWRMETITWDGDQLRAHCDGTKEFWLKQELYEVMVTLLTVCTWQWFSNLENKSRRCRACDETVAIEAHRRMQRQMKAGRR